MMKVLQNAMRLQAQRALAELEGSRIGLVTSYDPSTYMARVSLQPEGILTGWLPVAAAWAGNGWGMYAPPSINQMVDVDFIDDDLEAGIVKCALYNLEDVPLAVQSGELWLVHKTGAFFKLTNDGRLTISDGHGATVALNGDGTMSSAANSWTHTGPITIDGDVTISDNATIGSGASGTFTTPTGDVVTVQDGIVTNIF